MRVPHDTTGLTGSWACEDLWVYETNARSEGKQIESCPGAHNRTQRGTGPPRTNDLKTANTAKAAKAANTAKAAKRGVGVCLAMLAALAAFQKSKGF